MKVRVIDRPAWGTPNGYPETVTVEIADICPACGGPRGEPTLQSYHEDGASYAVHVWHNPCGHVDYYAAMLAEAAQEARA